VATTTAKSFDEFSETISLTTAQSKLVTDRAAIAKTLLLSTFPPTDLTPFTTSNLMGSCKRKTVIRPLDDLDVIAIFQNKDSVFETYRRDSQAFLYRLREKINAKTTVESVGARGQVVRLFYKDGLHVDIAPVFKWSGEHSGYALPSGNGGWITTDPQKQTEWASERQATLSNQFLRRVRMLKRWNNEHSKRLGSWHLEVMVGSAFGSMSNNSRQGIAKFFEWAPGYLHVNDPDGHGGDLGSKLTKSQEREVIESFSREHARALKALAAEDRGDHKEAIRIWRIVFGDDFPSYG
jgi:hypothetical protein